MLVHPVHMRYTTEHNSTSQRLIKVVIFNVIDLYMQYRLYHIPHTHKGTNRD
jgi:hypothetical protein